MGKTNNNSQGQKRILRNIFGGLAMNKYYNSRSILIFFIIGLLTTFFTSAVGNAGPLDTWISRHTGGNSLNGIAFGNGIFVAVGVGGRILTSPDGMTWALQTSGTGYDLYGITYANEKFAVVGSGGMILTSTNGTSWTQQTSGIIEFLNGVAYGNGTFVAVGDWTDFHITILTSPDGVTWTERGKTYPFDYLDGVSFGNGTFVAVGHWFNLSVIITSPDGITWTQQTVPYPNAIPLHGVTYGNGNFVAVGDAGKILTSPDGITWMHRTSSYDTYTFWGVTQGYGTFVVVGDECVLYDGDGSCVDFYSRILTSTDLTTWTSRIPGTYSTTLLGITPGNGTFVAVGDAVDDNGTILQSDPIGPTLTVTKAGTGTGTVRSQVEGINCGSDCMEYYNPDTIVTLTAAPDTGSYFAGWSVDSVIVSQALTCKVTMNAAKTVTAAFTTTPPPVATWVRNFGTTPTTFGEEAYFIEQTSDGGYIVAGNITPISGSTDILVMKLNSIGNVTWQKSYGGLYGDFAESIHQTADGGYIIAGYTFSFGATLNDLWMLKLNSVGAVTWEKRYGGSGNDRIFSAQQTSDGGYIVGGSEGTNFSVMKLDPSGNPVWAKRGVSSFSEDVNSIQQTSEGGYISAGLSTSAESSGDAWVVKVTSNGDDAWQRHYGNQYHQNAYLVQQTWDGGYIVAGVDDSSDSGNYKYDIWVLKLDSNGNVTWQKTYGGAENEHPGAIQQTSDGGYIVAGYTNSFGAGNYNMWVLKLDSVGNVTWQKTYGGIYNDYAFSIQQTPDGGYVVGGRSDSFSAGQYDYDILVLKLDPNGNILGCPSGLVIADSNATPGNPIITVKNTVVAAASTVVNVNTTSATVNSTSLTDNLVCTGIQTYSLTIVVSGADSVTLDPPGGTYNSGTSVTLTPNPGAGYFFYQWSGGGCSGTGSCIVTMDANKTVTATFLLSAGDSDGDGLPDGWEMTNFGNLNQGPSGDPDGDGYSNAREFAQGTIPNDPNSYLGVPDNERSALVDLYSSTNGAGWATRTNWLNYSVSECSWYGVTCAGTGNHVTSLGLDSNMLVGTIPSSISNLTNLQFLALNNNQLTGSIPTQLGSLTSLQSLILSSNKLTGDIPPDLGNLTNLLNLNLLGNQLTGSIPTSLESLTNLSHLDLSSNKLTGIIPSELGNLTSLTVLSLWSNQLTGNIPANLGNLPNLQVLYLFGNQLTGSIPPELGNLTNLQYLDLYNNKLTGSIPTQLGSLTNLLQLRLASNSLTGAIPVSLKSLTKLNANESDFRWNALYTTDDTLRTFLNIKQNGGDWESTQTVAPTNLTATVLSSTSVQLTWTPIAYIEYTGGYEVYYSTALEGPYTLYTTTGAKSDTTATVTGLTQGTQYFFRIGTVTNPNQYNQNTVSSEYTFPTSTGDGFDGEMIDRTMWKDLEFVREIVNQKLVSEVRAPNTNDSIGSTFRWANNSLNFPEPEEVTSIQADVSVLRIIHTNPQGGTRAMLTGRWYNDGTLGGGDIWAAVLLGATPAGGLQARWEVYRFTNPEGTAWQLIEEGNFVPAVPVTFGESYTLYIKYQSNQFTFKIGDITKTFGVENGLPNWAGNANTPFKGLRTRVWLQGPTESGYISATFDNVLKNGVDYDDFNDTSGMISKDRWNPWEFVRQSNEGMLESALARYGSNGSNSMSFVNSQAILGFEADLKVVDIQNSGARPQGRLYAALYNDGTGSSTPGDLKGDVTGAVGILDNGQGSGPQAFYAVFKCTAPNCNLPGEYEILTSGIFKNVQLNEIHRFSLSWNGVDITLGCDGSAISYNPTSLAPVAGPPKGRKGIGTRVSEISNSNEWAYVSAAFDNVVITKMDTDLDGLDDSWEMANFGNLSQGASEDYDGDGLTNLQEYQYGTNPKQANGPYTITVLPVTNGTITCVPTTVNYGGGSICTITPFSGYGILDVMVDGTISQGAISSYNFTSVTSSHTIYGTFAVDADGDGIADAVDNCPNVSNPNQEDSDGDGIGDACDNCPNAYNPDQADLDKDDIGDVCDRDADGDGYISIFYGGDDCNDMDVTVYPGSTTGNDCGSPAPKPPSGSICTDGDGDGKCDTQDNCPSVANADQLDTDQDGVGDACDNCPTVPNTDQRIPVWYRDYDGDGYSDGSTRTQCLQPTDLNMYGTGLAYKAANELIATSGDCNDNNKDVHPGAIEEPGDGIDNDCNPATPDSPYEIVFGEMSENGVLVNYDTWLPKDGVEIFARAKVRRVSGGAIIEPTTITLTFTPDTATTPSPDITHLRGKYTNDPTAVTDNTGPNGGPAPDYSVTSNSGGQVTLTCNDFGGTITFHADVEFTDGAQNYTLTNQLVKLPRDTDGDGIADAWEMAQFGTLNYGPLDGGPSDATANNLDKDGLTNFDEYRGFKWGRLVINDGSYGQCSVTSSRNCSTNAPCPTGETCVPYGYQTVAYVPELDSNDGKAKIVHFRTNPNKRDLFVKYRTYDGNYPFAIGEAYFKEGIDVYAIDESKAIAFFGGTGQGERKIDALLITNDSTNTFNNESPNLYKRNIRDWTFKVLGQSGFGNSTAYGSAFIYQKVLYAYFSDRPYKDSTTLQGTTLSGPWGIANGRLDPISKVEDANDNGKKNSGEDKNGNGLLDGDYPVPVTAGNAGPPWLYNQDLSPFNINKNFYNNDTNRPLVELPVASDPGNVNPAFEFTREQVLKHVTTHEIGHAVGVSVENADSTCVMYQYSTNWIRDNHFSSGAAGLIRIHNCCPTD